MEINIKLRKKSFTISGPMDLEGYWEKISRENEFSEDEIPYWSELWPSSLLLGKFILTNPHKFKGKKCLDLGCGLGLVSMALKYSQAIVYSQDIIFESLIFLKKNFSTNKLPYPVCIKGDWRCPCFKKHSLDIIVASDILYEKRFHIPVLKFIIYTLKKGGTAYISTPKREGAFDFFNQAPNYNLTSSLIKRNSIYINKVSTQIYLWKLTPISSLS